MKYLDHLRKFDRLLKLNGPTGISVPRLCRDTGVSRATAYRLIERLKELGAPVLRTKRPGFFRYEPGKAFELPGFWFSEGEIGALLGLMQWLGAPDSRVLEEIVGPLHKRLEEVARASGLDAEKLRSLIALLPMHAHTLVPGVLRQACEGLLAGRQLCLRHGPRGEERDRIVSPQKLVRYRDNWYLDAWCHEQEGLRSFALFRMRRARVLPKPALRLPIADLRAYFSDAYGIFSGPARHKAVIRFTGFAAAHVDGETWHPREEKKWEGGALILRVPYGDSRELLRDVLSHGEEAEVLEPPELRKEAAQRLQKAVQSYED